MSNLNIEVENLRNIVRQRQESLRPLLQKYIANLQVGMYFWGLCFSPVIDCCCTGPINRRCDGAATNICTRGSGYVRCIKIIRRRPGERLGWDALSVYWRGQAATYPTSITWSSQGSTLTQEASCSLRVQEGLNIYPLAAICTRLTAEMFESCTHLITCAGVLLCQVSFVTLFRLSLRHKLSREAKAGNLSKCTAASSCQYIEIFKKNRYHDSCRPGIWSVN